MKAEEKLKEKYPGWKFEMSTYSNRKSEIPFECTEGHKGKASFVNMMRAFPCTECKKKNVLIEKRKQLKKKGLVTIEYLSDDLVRCQCEKCGTQKVDRFRNLTYARYKCEFCRITSKMPFGYSLLEVKEGKLRIQCNEGHVYLQLRNNFFSGRKCDQCRIDNKSVSKIELLKMFRKKHGYRFEYSLEDYSEMRSKISIRCEKGHIFKQTASNHLQGKGCPICRESSGEREIADILSGWKIDFIRQKRFEGCRFERELKFDFFIPILNIAIEYDGIQHFEPIEAFGGTEGFLKTKERDRIKDEYCNNQSLKLIRISYLDNIQEKMSTVYEHITIQYKIGRV